MTFPSRDELKQAYEKLLRREELIHQGFEQAEPDLDQISNWVHDQQELMEEIEASEAVDKEVREESPDWLVDLLEDFAKLLNQNQQLIQQRMDDVQDRMDMLDQSVQLMSHYMQGEKRNEESTIQRFDREA